MLLKELEPLLRAKLGIADDKQVTLLGRIQNLQRLKFPAGTNTGRGRRVDYGWWEIIQFAVAFDLIDAGLPQEVASKLISANRDGIEFGVAAFSGAMFNNSAASDWVRTNKVPDGENAYLACAVQSLSSIKPEPDKHQSFIAYFGEDEVLRDGELNEQIIAGGNIILDLGQTIIFVLNYVALSMERGLDSTLNSFQDWLNSLHENTDIVR